MEGKHLTQTINLECKSDKCKQEKKKFMSLFWHLVNKNDFGALHGVLPLDAVYVNIFQLYAQYLIIHSYTFIILEA